jgi:serine/threonine protein kinase/Zn-finger nucleic acid-binding protein
MQERLGRYQILSPLATGGMGEIYLAEHTGLSGFAKRVAIKRISPSYATSEAYVELFLNEARVGSFLNHPNIVHIFDVGRDKSSLWIVMEYVDGIDLKRLLRRASLAGHPVDCITLASVMIEVLSALEEAHAGGPYRKEPIIHRDMSPENILIARSGAVKVLDFGLAKWAPGQSTVPSMEGNQIFGKIRYMPPEQLKGELIDVRADLFALGVVMYEALTGELPFGSEDANSVLAAIMAGRPPSPSAELGARDKEMDAIIYKAMDPHRDRRYRTASEMRAALIGYLEDSGAVLPFESLRRMLRPGSPISSSGTSRGEDGLHKIDLGVVNRCGKCGGNFSAFFLDGLIVDRCTSCRGVWLDQGEMERLLGAGPGVRAPDTGPQGKYERAPLDELHGSCPSCKIGLRRFAVPNKPASLEICPNCHGTWFDQGELRLLEDENVVRWLRGTLDSVRQSSASPKRA